MSGKSLEIERVFLLRAAPRLSDEVERLEIDQGYFPSDGNLEGRIRRVRRGGGKTSFTHTVKRGAGLVREEEERSIDQAEFDRLWCLTEGRRISKRRSRVPDGPLVWEIDEFVGLPPIEGRSLVLAEVEIPRGVDPSSVRIPEWLAGLIVREVTHEPRFRNYALATRSATI